MGVGQGIRKQSLLGAGGNGIYTIIRVLPSLDSLLCFVEAARLSSFRSAARAVGLTPAAVGQRIRQLEDQAGAQLFQRTTRKVVLTQAGLAFLPHARAAIASAEQAMRAGRGEATVAPMRVTIGTRHELGMSWIVPMLPRLRAAHPGLSIDLYFGSGVDLLIRVRTLEIDCAVGSMRQTDSTLDATRLHREDYDLVAAPRLLARTPFRHPRDAARHVLFDAHTELPLFSYWRDAPRGTPLDFGAVRLMGTIAAIRALVLRGEGVAVLPAYLVTPDLRAGRLVRLLPRVELAHDYFRLIFRGDDPRKSVYAALAQTMAAVPLR
jgi:DNA-binding transcriptional LysR family regulator